MNKKKKIEKKEMKRNLCIATSILIYIVQFHALGISGSAIQVDNIACYSDVIHCVHELDAIILVYAIPVFHINYVDSRFSMQNKVQVLNEIST